MNNKCVGKKLKLSSDGTFKAINTAKPEVFDDLDYMHDDNVFSTKKAGKVT